MNVKIALSLQACCLFDLRFLYASYQIMLFKTMKDELCCNPCPCSAYNAKMILNPLMNVEIALSFYACCLFHLGFLYACYQIMLCSTMNDDFCSNLCLQWHNDPEYPYECEDSLVFLYLLFV